MAPSGPSTPETAATKGGWTGSSIEPNFPVEKGSFDRITARIFGVAPRVPHVEKLRKSKISELFFCCPLSQPNIADSRAVCCSTSDEYLLLRT